jgi:hypothetical protein
MLVAVCALPAPLLAQDLRFLPMRSDSIYRLTVDSAQYPTSLFVYLLDDGIAKFESDGRGVERFHQIVQILRPGGVPTWAERALSFRPGHSRIQINAMRVIGPKGDTISEQPSMMQSSDVPAAMSNPVYSDIKVLRYSLRGVAPGTLVDIDWSVEHTDPFLAGDFLTSWRTSMDVLVQRSRFVVDIPESLTPRVVEHHPGARRIDEHANGRHYIAWMNDAVAPIVGEAFAPDSSVPITTMVVGSPLKWTDVTHWYAGLAKDHYALSEKAKAKVDSVVRNARTSADTLTALHHWIAADIRYVSIALGLDGYRPHQPDSTLAAGSGDCKDKATLFIAAARHLGIAAYPVLLKSTGIGERTIPSLSQLDHMIAAVQTRASPSFTFLDLTTDLFPVGTVPPQYQGTLGLLVRADGASEEVTFPRSQKGRVLFRFEGEVGVDGKANGVFDFTAQGGDLGPLRLALGQPLDSIRRGGIRQSMGQVFANNTVDSIQTFDGHDLSAPVNVKIRVHDGEAFRPNGSAVILPIPPTFRGIMARAAIVQSVIARSADRRLPIEAAQLFSPGLHAEIILTLPEGWRAQLPQGATMHSAFGDFRSEFTQSGRTLTVLFDIDPAYTVRPKEDIADLRAWIAGIVAGSADAIVLTPAKG